MNITTTPMELMEIGLWEKFCEFKGFNPWCVNEGQVEKTETITLTQEEANEIGLIKKEVI